MGRLLRRLRRRWFFNYHVLVFKAHRTAPYAGFRYDCLARALDAAEWLASTNPGVDVRVVNARIDLLYQTHPHTECRNPKEHR